METKPLPGCKAILLCERTMIEAGSGKISLIALIDILALPFFPSRTRPMKPFLHLVNGIGDSHIHVEVHALADDESLIRRRRSRFRSRIGWRRDG